MKQVEKIFLFVRVEKKVHRNQEKGSFKEKC